MRRQMLGLLGVFLLTLLAGCSRGGQDLPDVGVSLSIQPEPPQIGPADVTVRLTGANDLPIIGAEVEIEGNMNHAGMVPVLAIAEEVELGTYETSLEFTMGGDWFIVVRAQLPDGRRLERVVDVPGVDVMCGETPQP